MSCKINNRAICGCIIKASIDYSGFNKDKTFHNSIRKYICKKKTAF